MRRRWRPSACRRLRAAARVDLAGEWQIAWGRFEDPAAPPADAGSRGLIEVPGPWNGAALPGKGPGGFGHATYRLNAACRAPGRLAFVLPIQHSAMRLYVNGRLVAAQGSPGSAPESAQPAFVQQIAVLEAAACPLQIVAHVSNFEMRNGGLLRAIELGDEREVLARRERGLARDLFALGGVAVLSLLPVLFWLWRRKEQAPLWLGVYGLASLVFLAAGGERIAQPWMAPLGWEVCWKIVLTSMMVGLAAFPSFVRALYPAYFPRLAHRALLAPLALLALLILATPARIYTQAVPLIYAMWVAVGSGCVLVLIRAALGGQRGAWLLLAGFALLTAAGVHDTLQVSYQIANKLTPYGLLAFSVAPVLLLARRFARALRAEELRSIEQQQRADLLVHATQAGLLDWDATSNVTAYSDRFKEMLGYPADTDSAQWPPLFDFIHPEDRERVRASFLAQLRDRETRGGMRLSHDPADYRLRCADGSYVWIHAEAISITGADGRTLRYICSFIDISARKQQELELQRGELALRESDARYHFAMRAINEGIYDWNVRDGTIFYSESVYRALGMPESMRTPQDWRERIHPEDEARYAAAIPAASNATTASAAARATGAGRASAASPCATSTAARSAWSARPATSPSSSMRRSPWRSAPSSSRTCSTPFRWRSPCVTPKASICSSTAGGKKTSTRGARTSSGNRCASAPARASPTPCWRSTARCSSAARVRWCRRTISNTAGASSARRAA